MWTRITLIRAVAGRTPTARVSIRSCARPVWIAGRHEPGTILTEMDGRKYRSTTENPNSVTGPEISGLTPGPCEYRVAQLCSVVMDHAFATAIYHKALARSLRITVHEIVGHRSGFDLI